MESRILIICLFLFLIAQNGAAIVFLSVTNGGRFHILTVESSDTIGSIKERLAGEVGVPVDQMELLYENKHLDDKKTLADYSCTRTQDFIKEPPLTMSDLRENHSCQIE